MLRRRIWSLVFYHSFVLPSLANNNTSNWGCGRRIHQCLVWCFLWIEDVEKQVPLVLWWSIGIIYWMASVEEKIKTGGVGVGVGVGVVGGQTQTQNLVAEMKLLKEMQEHCGLFPFFSLTFSKWITRFYYVVSFVCIEETKINLLLWFFTCLFMLLIFSGVRRTLNSELWHACAGPLVSLPQVGSLVYYFPQGHSEQVNEHLFSCYKPYFINVPKFFYNWF